MPCAAPSTVKCSMLAATWVDRRHRRETATAGRFVTNATLGAPTARHLPDRRSAVIATPLAAPYLGGPPPGLRLRQATVDVDCSPGLTTGSRFVELVQVSHDGRFVR